MRLSVSLLGLAGVSAVTPVQKVVQMLGEMVERGKAEKAQEAEIFEKIESTVQKQLLDLSIEIKHQKELVEKYDAHAAAVGGVRPKGGAGVLGHFVADLRRGGRRVA